MRRGMTGWFAALACCASAQGEPDFLDAGALHDAGLAKSWQLRLPLEPGQRVRDAYLVDDQIYVATEDGHCYAVHALTGALRWVREITTGGYRILRPCHAGDRVVFVTAARVLQLSRAFGEPIRDPLRGSAAPLAPVALRFPAGTGAVSDGRQLYIGGLDRRFYAFGMNRDFENWKAGVVGPISSTPVIQGRDLYVADESGRVYKCVARNKALLWSARTTGPITADLVVDANGVYAASRDQSLWLFDVQFGEVRWRARFSGSLFEAPVTTPDTAYQYSPADGLAAVNTALLANRRVRWTNPRGRLALSVDGRRLFALSKDESLLVIDPASGDVLSEIPAAGFTMGMPQASETVVFLASDDGRLFCARGRGAPLVRADDVRRALLGPQAAPEPPPAAVVKPTPPTAADVLAAPAAPPLGGKSRVSREWTGRGGDARPTP